jgi:hypothetical protein
MRLHISGSRDPHPGPMHAPSEKIHVTLNATRPNPNAIGHVWRIKRQNPTDNPLVAQWTLCAFAWIVLCASVVTTWPAVNDAKTLVVVCTRPR